MNSTSDDWHANTQNDEYLNLSIERLKEPRLMWVDQVVELLEKNLNLQNYTLKDIGCNVGHFYRGIIDCNLQIEYTGYDVSETYIDLASSYFATDRFKVQDFSRSIDLKKFQSDVSVISATLEHVENWENMLKNIFQSTSKIIIIRTFIGSKYLRDYCQKPNSQNAYIVQQFTEENITSQLEDNFWEYSIISDVATEGMAKTVCKNVVRTMKIIVIKRVP